jgi:succinoglycan biosynthesis transport protein ExoP
MNPVLKRRIEQVRRGWWIVLLIAGVGAAVAVLISLTQPTTYVGKSVLILSSTGRSPDQDATVAVGYAKLFNEPATVNRLREAANIPGDIEFEAQTVAASPILTIAATADGPAVAQDAAQQMAQTFSEDVNSVRQKGTEKAIQDLQGQVDDLRAQPQPNGVIDPQLGVMQDRLDAMKTDTTNQLTELQLRAGVTEIAPVIGLNLATGILGGLLLGVFAAIGLASLSTKIRTAEDLVHKTGIEPLAEVPAAGSADLAILRDERIRALANTISLQDLPKSPVIALTDCPGVRAALDVATELAELSARQGLQTVLVRVDTAEVDPAKKGLTDALADTSLVPALLQADQAEMLTIISYGSSAAGRSYLTRERLGSVLDEIGTRADTVIVVAPSISSTTDAQIVCAAADTTLLIAGVGSTTANDVQSAVATLRKTHAEPIGVVLVAGADAA